MACSRAEAGTWATMGSGVVIETLTAGVPAGLGEAAVAVTVAFVDMVTEL